MSRIEVQLADWQLDRVVLMDIRTQVFICEQQVPPALEWDEEDISACHFIAYKGDAAVRTAVGTARLLRDGRIGRMAVLRDWRGQGVGSALLNQVLKTARQRGDQCVHLDAQLHAIGFYEGKGFTALGEVFMDAGIPHRRMQKPLD